LVLGNGKPGSKHRNDTTNIQTCQSLYPIYIKPLYPDILHIKHTNLVSI